MMKWLREHSKKIMVALVLLAMFSFVGGSALQNILRRKVEDIVVMKVFGHEMNQGDLNLATIDTEILERLFIDWTNGHKGELTVRHWLMLSQEAERAGVTVSEKDVDEILTQREQMLQQFNAGSLADIRKRQKVSMAAIRSAVARQMAIGQNFERIRLAALPSEPQVRHFVRATEDKAQVTFASLDAERFVDPAEPVTEAELQAQYDAHRDVAPADSPDGFGYKQPRRVKLQYVQASISKIEAQVDVGLDEIKNHWKTNSEKYKKLIVVEEPVTSGPAASQPSSMPASQPATRKTTKQVQKTFSESREEIVRELRNNKAQKLARQVMTRLAEELSRPWNDTKSDSESGYRPIPKGVDDAAYLRSVASQVCARYGVTIDFQETGLVSAEELDSDVNLRGADTPGDNEKPMKLSEFAFRVPSFHKPASETDSSLRLQLFQTPLIPLTIAGTPRFDWATRKMLPAETMSYVLFRVIEARETEPPASLNEVRAHVERDVRLLKAYHRVEPIAQELCAVASRVGLESALTHFEDLRMNRGVRSVSSPPPFARMTALTDPDARESAIKQNRPLLDYTSVPGIGKSEPFIEACFEMTDESWVTPTLDVGQTPAIQAATTQPAASPAPKVRTVPLISQHKWLVVQLVNTTPVNTDSYENEKRSLAFQHIAGDRSMAARLAWFDVKSVEKRCDYLDLQPGASGRSSQGAYTTPEIPPMMGY